MVLDVKKIKGTRRVAKGFMGKVFGSSGIWSDDLLKRRKLRGTAAPYRPGKRRGSTIR